MIAYKGDGMAYIQCSTLCPGSKKSAAKTEGGQKPNKNVKKLTRIDSVWRKKVEKYLELQEGEKYLAKMCEYVIMDEKESLRAFFAAEQRR